MLAVAVCVLPRTMRVGVLDQGYQDVVSLLPRRLDRNHVQLVRAQTWGVLIKFFF